VPWFCPTGHTRELPAGKDFTMNLNLALSNRKLFAFFVLVLLTALVVISFLLFAVAHINVLHLFDSHTAIVPTRF
jgi:hypothetical protein